MSVIALEKQNLSSPKASASAGASGRLGELCRRPGVWICLILLLAAGYGYAMAVPAVDMDDLAIDTYYGGGEFLRQGRVTVWLLQALTGILTWQPFWPELFAGVCLALAGLALAAAVEDAAGTRLPLWQVLLLDGGLLLWPYHGEILVYSNQCGIGLGYLLCVSAAMLAGRHLFSGWRYGLPGALGAAVCLALALGLYESFAPVWLTLVFVLLLLRAGQLPGDTRLRGRLSAILRGVWPLAAGLVLRQGLKLLLCGITGVSGEDGTASTTIFWFTRSSLRDAVLIPLREFLRTYLARAFGVPALATLALACLGLLLWAVIRRGQGRGLYAAGLLVSQFSLGILQGTGSQMSRASQCFAVFVPFVFWLLLRSLAGRGRIAGRLAIAVTCLLLLAEALSLNDTFLVNRQRWQYEEQQLTGIARQLDALDPSGQQPVVFAGRLPVPQQLHDRVTIPLSNPGYKVSWLVSVCFGGPNGELLRYENPQTMVINWAQDAFGGQEQLYLLMQAVGRPCTRPDDAQKTAGNAAAGTLPAWPQTGSVSAQQGYLLVNLGAG